MFRVSALNAYCGSDEVDPVVHDARLECETAIPRPPKHDLIRFRRCLVDKFGFFCCAVLSDLDHPGIRKHRLLRGRNLIKKPWAYNTKIVGFI